MATHTGSEGTVHIGTSAVVEIRSYTLNETASTVEDTTMGDVARTFKPSLTSFDGTIDVYWDETDTDGQALLVPSAQVTIKFYPEGTANGDTYYTGTAIVTSRSISASFDNMVEMSIGVQGTGALTTATA
jgi:hypothetical protein